MRILSRNSFGRYSIVKRNAEPCYHECAWCGAKRIRPGWTESTYPAVKTLYQYGIDDDQRAGVRWEARAYCSKSCREAWGGKLE